MFRSLSRPRSQTVVAFNMTMGEFSSKAPHKLTQRHGVGQVGPPAGDAILNPGWTPTPLTLVGPGPASSIGVVTVHSSSRGSARGLAPDVGGKHVGLLGGGAPVGRWAPAGRARVRRPGGHAVPAALPIPGLSQRHGRRAGAASSGGHRRREPAARGSTPPSRRRSLSLPRASRQGALAIPGPTAAKELDPWRPRPGGIV